MHGRHELVWQLGVEREMTTRNYYPLPPVASSGGGTFGIKNMWDTLQDAVSDQQQKYTGNPSGSLTLQFSAIVGGGTPPYTYSWSAGNGEVAISDQTVSNPIFSASGSGSPTKKASSFTLTATDSSTPAALTDTKYIDIGLYFDVAFP